MIFNNNIDQVIVRISTANCTNLTRVNIFRKNPLHP